MRKNLKALLAMPLVCFFVACGGNNQSQSVKLKPHSTEVGGDLKEHLEVVDAEYELLNDFGAQISIKLKAKKVLEGFDFEDGRVDLNLSVLNGDGNPISGTDKMSSYLSSAEINAILKKGTGEIVVEFNGYGGVTEEAKKFVVFSSLTTYEPSGLNTDKTSSNEDFDQALDDYEDYVNNIVALNAKMRQGDVDAIEEYADLMEDTEEVMKSLENAKDAGEMSAEQMARLLKIQAKALKAVK